MKNKHCGGGYTEKRHEERAPKRRLLYLTPFPLTFLIHILDAVDPLVLLLRCGSRDTIHHVVSFHYSPISLRLARLDQLTAVVGDV